MLSREGAVRSDGNKKKIAAVIVIALLLAIGGVFAYLTATDSKTNKFTLSSKLDIEVLEPAWNADDDHTVLPMQNVSKDPYIHNKTGNSAYMFADVVIPTANIIVADAEGNHSDAAALTELFSYSLPDDTKWQLIDVIDGSGTRTFRYAWTEVVEGNGNTGNLFTSVTACNYIDEQISASMKTQNIVITGYGIQARGFADEGTTPAWAKAWLGYIGENSELGAPNNLMLETTSEYTGTETVVFRSYAPVESLVGVTIDGVSIDEENYVATSGSTVITFTNEYMQTLSNNWHIVTIDNGITYGAVSSKFKTGIDETESTKTPAELAAEYQAAYDAAATVNSDYVGHLGGEIIWWMDDTNIIHIAPVNGKSGTIVKRWSSSSPFDSVKTVATSAVVEPGVNAGTNMSTMFYNCSALTSLDVSNLDTSNVSDMGYVFASCSSLASLTGLSNWNTSKVTTMREMFRNCNNLASLDLSGFDTSKVTTMHQMFFGCHNLASLDLSGFDTSSLGIMHKMFNSCDSLESLDLTNFDTSNVVDMYAMFQYCSSLTSIIGLSDWNTSKVTDMGYMFQYCSSLISLGDLSNWDVSNVISMTKMFNRVPSSVTRPSWATTNAR